MNGTENCGGQWNLQIMVMFIFFIIICFIFANTDFPMALCRVNTMHQDCVHPTIQNRCKTKQCSWLYIWHRLRHNNGALHWWKRVHSSSTSHGLRWWTTVGHQMTYIIHCIPRIGYHFSIVSVETQIDATEISPRAENHFKSHFWTTFKPIFVK